MKLLLALTITHKLAAPNPISANFLAIYLPLNFPSNPNSGRVYKTENSVSYALHIFVIIQNAILQASLKEVKGIANGVLNKNNNILRTCKPDLPL